MRPHPRTKFWKNTRFNNHCCFLSVLVFCLYSSRPLWFGIFTQWLYQPSFKCFGSYMYVRFNQDARTSFVSAVIAPLLQSYWCCIYNLLICESTEFILERTTQSKSVKVLYKPCSSMTSSRWTTIHSFHVTVVWLPGSDEWFNCLCLFFAYSQ